MSESITRLKGVGPALATKLAKIGLETTQDLVFHLPLRFEDRTRVTPMGQLQMGQFALVVGAVEQVKVSFGRRRSLLVRLSDGHGWLTLRLFYFNAQQQRQLESAQWVHCYGEVRRGPQSLEMVHPEYRTHEVEPGNITSDCLTPVYPTTEGVGQARIRSLVTQPLQQHLTHTADLIPDNIRSQHGLMPLSQALQTLHFPTPDVNLAKLLNGSHPAQQRLALEELLAHHLALRQIRAARKTVSAPVIKTTSTLWQQLKSQLGFDLTKAQNRVIDEIIGDLQSGSSTLRLIQGDVGSGKTVVAAASAMHVVESGMQVAIMAPTELLAEQHRVNFQKWCEPLGISTTWLTGRLPAAKRRLAIEGTASGAAQIVIGTHALFQESVEFKHLGLIIVDEQHRFGVNQRLALKQKGESSGQSPHQIIMSATPIPRSLSMVYYADLDVSNIDELPPGRKPVNTVVLPDSRREEIQTRIRDACQSGVQAYWVCPLIDESELLQAQAATETEAALSVAFPDLKIALVHGRMKAAKKDAVMQRFRDGKVNLLVATTVIEVGVDVPNATLMIIENAERLGLAQLHQLRGRVGRGEQQSVCVLMYQSPLGKISRQRLDIMRRTTDGFEIARKDLEQRGPGELMGTRQTGENQMRIANIVRDQHLLPLVEETATALNQSYPERIEPIIRRWVHRKADYAEV